MQPHSSPPFGPSTPQAGAAERPNEFSEAVARMFSNRPKMAFADAALPTDDSSERERSSWSLRNALPPGDELRRAILIAPVAVVGFFVFWFFVIEPSPPALPVGNVIEAKAEARVAANPVPAAVREEVVEARAVPQPEPVAPAPQPTMREISAAPLSKDEIREMQGKLGAMGFGPGPVDGVVGPQTQAALKRYAQSRNLSRSDPTQEVLARLREETPAKP